MKAILPERQKTVRLPGRDSSGGLYLLKKINKLIFSGL
jgi:hypothetical protein